MPHSFGGTSNYEDENRNCAAQFPRDLNFSRDIADYVIFETVQHSFGGTSNFEHVNRNCAAQFRRDIKF